MQEVYDVPYKPYDLVQSGYLHGISKHPDLPLVDLFHLMHAIYKKEVGAYIRKKLPNYKLLAIDRPKPRGIKGCIEGGWKMILVRNNITSECIAVWSGVDNWETDIIKTIVYSFAAPEALIQEMGKCLEHWQEKFGYIGVFLGHSFGGYFVSRVKPESEWPGRWRITVNAQEPLYEGKSLHFRCQGDLLSWVLNSRKKYWTLEDGSKGHSIKDLYHVIRDEGITWETIILRHS